MSYQVTARKWRPMVFEDVVGQSHVTTTLRNALSSKRVAHAYIFSGQRGCGKTTTARILAKAAFNALLKTLEEPPPHVMFIFATTEVHKVPATILSRCQRFDFRRISIEEIMTRLRYIAG